MGIEFKGIVSSRSSKGKHWPPGEAAIQALNPQRKALILHATGWATLFPGSLNIDVQETELQQLLKHEPLITEPGNTVIYPAGLEHIPKMRGEYLYFKAVVTSEERNEEVLVRIARNPVRLQGPVSKVRLELLAPMRLRDAINLEDGCTVSCRVVSPL